MRRWVFTAGLAALAAASVAALRRAPAPPVFPEVPLSGPRHPLAVRVLPTGLVAVAARDDRAVPRAVLAFRIGAEGLPELLAPLLGAGSSFQVSDGLLVATTGDLGDHDWLDARWEEVRRLRELAPEAAPWLVLGNAVWVGVHDVDPQDLVGWLAVSVGGRAGAVDEPLVVTFPSEARRIGTASTIGVPLRSLHAEALATALVLAQVLEAPDPRDPYPTYTRARVRRVDEGGWLEVSRGCVGDDLACTGDLLDGLRSWRAGPEIVADAIARATVEREWALQSPRGLTDAVLEAWAAGAPLDLDATSAALPRVTAADLEALAREVSRAARTPLKRRRSKGAAKVTPSRGVVDRQPFTTLSRSGRVVAVQDPEAGTFRLNLVHDVGWRDVPLACEAMQALVVAPPSLPPGVRLRLRECRWTRSEWELDGPAPYAHDALRALDHALDHAEPVLVPAGSPAFQQQELRALVGAVEQPLPLPARSLEEALRRLGRSGTRAAWYGREAAEEVEGWLTGPAWTEPVVSLLEPPAGDELLVGAGGGGVAAVRVESSPAELRTRALLAWTLDRRARERGLSARMVPLGPRGPFVTTVVDLSADADTPVAVRDLLRTTAIDLEPPARRELARVAADWRWGDAAGPDRERWPTDPALAEWLAVSVSAEPIRFATGNLGKLRPYEGLSVVDE